MTRFYFIPDDYCPSDKTIEAAKSMGLSDKQIMAELDKCRDHQYKRPMIDPDRCFRNWLRNAIKFGDVTPSVTKEYRKQEAYTEEQRKADEAKALEDMDRLKQWPKLNQLKSVK